MDADRGGGEWVMKESGSFPSYDNAIFVSFGNRFIEKIRLRFQKPVYHLTVEQIWYCIAGDGEVWRKQADLSHFSGSQEARDQNSDKQSSLPGHWPYHIRDRIP
jgi:mannose-6-phosphate isomerase-like protein (cupin superfamily)